MVALVYSKDLSFLLELKNDLGLSLHVVRGVLLPLVLKIVLVIPVDEVKASDCNLFVFLDAVQNGLNASAGPGLELVLGLQSLLNVVRHDF